MPRQASGGFCPGPGHQRRHGCRYVISQAYVGSFELLGGVAVTRKGPLLLVSFVPAIVLLLV